MNLKELKSFKNKLLKNFPKINNHPDIAGLFLKAGILNHIGEALALPFKCEHITKVVSPEARGPILGALVAKELNTGLILARKEYNNHPGADIYQQTYENWRGHKEIFKVRNSDFDTNDNILIIDDWITTGSSIEALKKLIENTGSNYSGSSVIVNKSNDKLIKSLNVSWLAKFSEI